jgi:prevent-host-death family protein
MSYNPPEFGPNMGDSMATSIVSLSVFKAKAARMLEQIRESQDHLVLTQNGAATAVVQDYESYQRVQDSLAMLKLMVQGESDIQAKRTTSQKRTFATVRARLERGDA